MKYIVDTITDLVINKTPEKTGEMMIRIDGFQDIRIYESIAKKLTDFFKETTLSTDIKMTASAFNELKKNADNLSF